jgi:hypothetical protein
MPGCGRSCFSSARRLAGTRRWRGGRSDYPASIIRREPRPCAPPFLPRGKAVPAPDAKVVTVPTDGARFVIDIVASGQTVEAVSASLVVVQSFPMEMFRPRIKEGEDATALLKNIQFYTLLRLHEVIPAQANDSLCTQIVVDIREKVLTQEYTERAD